MIFADNRYSRSDKRKKLPQWLSHHLKQEYWNLSTDVAVDIASKFVKKMAQPHSKKDEIGKSLLSLKHIVQLQEKIRKQYGGHGQTEESQFAVLDASLSQRHRRERNVDGAGEKNHNRKADGAQ